MFLIQVFYLAYNLDQLLFHPKIVHLPIALGVLMPPVALGVLLAWWRGRLPRQTWIVVIALQATLVGTGFLALESGEADEEIVERVVAEAPIEAHEEAAEVFFWASVGVLGLMLVGGLLPRRAARLSVATAAVLGTLVVLGLGYRTGEAGGQLVYRHGAAQVHVHSGSGVQSPATRTGHADDDDD